MMRQTVRLSPLLLVLLAACGYIAPAPRPAILDATPGPGVIITDEWVDAGVFWINYPDSWRVVTGAATEPLSVIFVRPDERAAIVVSVAPLESLPQLSPAGLYDSEQRTIVLDDDTPIYTGMVYMMRDDDALADYERALSTLTAGG